MVHPTNLLRSDSDGAQRFSAPVGNYLNEIDCGIKALPCLAEHLNLQKFAKLSVFVVVLSLMGCVQGIIGTYFKGTSQLWTSHYNFPNFAKALLLVSNQLFVGVFALCISYWGNRIHRATWMGALTMLIAVSGVTLAITEIYKPFAGIEITNSITGPNLCGNFNVQQTSNISIENPFDEVMFGVALIFQLIYGIAIISFICHGLTYIDDHISAKHSPALICVALAALEMGKQGGIYFSWMPYVLNINGIFLSPIWIIIMIVTFLIGVAMAMFPKVLPNIVLKKSVNSLVSIASGGDPTQDEEVIDGYIKTLRKLLNNKILLLNILSFVLVQSAIINFGLFEKYFTQSKFHVPIKENDSSGYSDPTIMQFTTNLLRQPLVAISLVTSGLVVAKLRPKPKYLITWNIAAFVLVILIFSSTAFINCTHGIQNEHKHSITIPFCSSLCACPLGESFQPVCVDGKTYFSPCRAGCKSFTPETMVYHNCSCGSIVTEGSCDDDGCKFILAMAEVNNVISSAIIASTLSVNVIITLRSVAKQDKATALGLHLTFFGIVPFVPVNIMYTYISVLFCEISTNNGCQYFSEYFPPVVSLITITLEACGVILSIVLLYYIRNLNLYENRINYDYELNNFHTRINNDTANINYPDSEPNEEITVVEEQSPFIRELKERMSHASVPSVSREERIQSYIEEGELVPSLPVSQRKSSKSSSKSKGIKSKLEGKKSETPSNTNSSEALNNNVVVHKAEVANRPNSRNSNKRNSKASAESDMSSLYRFADSIEGLEDNSSQSSSRANIAEAGSPSNQQKLTVYERDVPETNF